MLIKFIGPVSRVTGSCYHLIDDARGMEYLVDFGLVQSEGNQIVGDGQELPFDVGKIGHVFLTHAHLDHAGMIPYLYKKGYRGRVWATAETAELADINLRNAVGLGNLPYDVKDINSINWHEPMTSPLFGKLFTIETDLYGCFFRSAHIAGAVSIGLTWGKQELGQRTIVFSGDLGCNADGQETQAMLKYRMDARDIDYAVCESTYGDVRRKPVSWEDRLDELTAAVDQVIEQEGVGILPAFSIGRCQDLLLDLSIMRARDPSRYEGLDVWFDAPMGWEVNKAYARAVLRTDTTRKGKVKPMWLNARLLDWLGFGRSAEAEVLVRKLVASVLLCCTPPADIATMFPDSLAAQIDGRWIKRVKGRKPVPEGRPMLVVCSSGMCNGGAVVEYIKAHVASSKTSLIFTGYVAAGTLGRKLLSMKAVPLEERKKMDDVLEFETRSGPASIPARTVEATMTKINGYSGHADPAGLCDWLVPPKTGKPVAPTVFLTHGTDQARRGLEEYIRDKHVSAVG